MELSKEELVSSLNASSLNGEVNDLNPEDFLEDLGIDSLGFVTLIAELENEFGIEVEPESISELEDKVRVADILELLSRYNVFVKGL